MTLDEALAEAKRRWGDRGVCQMIVTGFTLDQQISYAYAVGEASAPHTWNALGQGSSWQEAFDNAAPPRRRRRP